MRAKFWKAYCTITTKAQTASAPLDPKLLKKIWAMGCGLLDSDSRSVPIQKASTMLMAATGQCRLLCFSHCHAPVPSTPAMKMANTIAHGTATEAFEASSLICTLESKEPENTSTQPIGNRTTATYISSREGPGSLR